MVHIYHGDGKGKTTAAMGIALRMLGNGKRVFIVQFLKGKPSGEILALLKMEGATVLRGRPDTKFVFQMTENELLAVAALHTRQLDLAVAAAKDGKAELIVLDEALDAIATGTLDEGRLLDGLAQIGPCTEVIITGRNPSARLLGKADYVTVMKKEKHPYDQGIPARCGIEY